MRMYTTDKVMIVLKLYIHGVKSSDDIKVIHYSLSREAVAWFLMYASRSFAYAYKNMYNSGSQMEGILPPLELIFKLED